MTAALRMRFGCHSGRLPSVTMLAKALDVGGRRGPGGRSCGAWHAGRVRGDRLLREESTQPGRADTAEQARPYVIAEFVSGFLIDFRIRNLGTTMAKNVRFSWDRCLRLG